MCIVCTVLLVLVQPAFAQDITFAEKANQRSVEVYISNDGSIHVKHIVAKSSTPKQIELITGMQSNIEVADEQGNTIQHATIGGGLGMMLFPSNVQQIVQYDLSDVLEKDGSWKWNFRYLESTKFFFPENIHIIFIDGQPVMLNDKRAINCHGCEMDLEFFEDTDIQTKSISWEQHEFDLPIHSLAHAENLRFDQPGKNISFEPSRADEFFIIILPLELLWEPYQVYQGSEKILFHSYIKNDTHVWLSAKPTSTDTVTIIGTTVVPEFSLFLPLILGATLIVVLQYKTRLTLH